MENSETKTGLKVLSLFDGVSCARLALEKAGIDVSEYYSSEIDPYAVKVVKYHRPDTIHLGDVKHVKSNMPSGPFLRDIKYTLKDIDLLIGGSPCQDLSVAKKGRLGLEGNKSSLFFEYVRILHEVKPKWFILENVATMPEKDKAIISETLGVQPILIDAGLVSSQDRRRLFWTNIPNISQPQDRNLFLKDIMEPQGVDITAQFNAKVEGTLSFKKSRSNIRTPEQKAKTLTASGQNISNSGATNIRMPDGSVRGLTPIECERLQCMPDNWTKGDGSISKTQRYKMAGNAFNVDVVAHILGFMVNAPKSMFEDIAPVQQEGIPSPFSFEEFMEGFSIVGDEKKMHNEDEIVMTCSLMFAEILNAPLVREAKLSNISVVLRFLMGLNIINQTKANHIMNVIDHNEKKRGNI